MEVFRFDHDKSEKAFDQEAFKKLFSMNVKRKKQFLSAQLLFVTKNKDQKLCSADLNSFTYYKIVEGLKNFGTSFDSKDINFIDHGNNESFFVQFSDKIGARIDNKIGKDFFGKSKKEQEVIEICKKVCFTQSNLEIFIVVQKLESKILCFIFGQNGEDLTNHLTKKQVHHYLLCLHAFTELK